MCKPRSSPPEGGCGSDCRGAGEAGVSRGVAEGRPDEGKLAERPRRGEPGFPRPLPLLLRPDAPDRLGPEASPAHYTAWLMCSSRSTAMSFSSAACNMFKKSGESEQRQYLAASPPPPPSPTNPWPGCCCIQMRLTRGEMEPRSWNLIKC